MRKNVFLSISTIMITIMLVSCDTLSGHRGLSENISESKERGVFVAEYKPPSNPVIINDTTKITITDAWLERQWAYDKKGKAIIFNDELFQLCVNTREADIQYLGETWSIGVDFNQSIRKSGEASLIGDFSKLPLDTIIYKVQDGTELSKNYKKVIIGNFVLIKSK